MYGDRHTVRLFCTAYAGPAASFTTIHLTDCFCWCGQPKCAIGSLVQHGLSHWTSCDDLGDDGVGARTGTGTSIRAGTGTGQTVSALALMLVSVPMLRLRVQHGIVKEAMRKEMKGILAGLVNEGGGHGDVYDTERRMCQWRVRMRMKSRVSCHT